MLPLPFLEVSCVAPGGFPSMTVVHQSGLQIMSGSYSVTSAQFTREQIRRNFQNQAPKNNPDERLEAAPLMIVIPFLLLGGIAVGLAVGPTTLRVILVACLVVSALVLLFIQMAVGFPLEREIDQANRQAGVLQENQRRARQAGGDKFAPVVNAFEGVENMLGGTLQTHYTPWFWLWLLFLIGSFGPLVGEFIWALAQQPPRRRAASADEY
jgi:hypothetical protein